MIIINNSNSHNNTKPPGTAPAPTPAPVQPRRFTPGLHNKIPAHKIFARVWVAQEPIFSEVAKIFQGLGPKRQKSCDGDRVYRFAQI